MKKWRRIIYNVFVYTRYFGFRIGYWETLYPYLKYLGYTRMPNSKTMQQKHRAIESYLTRRYAEMIESYRNEPTEIKPLEEDFPVWVCWWQGKERMPEIVKCCYLSLCRSAGNHPVRLIDERNYAEYVTIPPYILEKLKKGNLSVTNFSDILRVCLLYEHGGLWIDATVWVTRPFSFPPETVFISATPVGVEYPDRYVSCRWCTFLMGAAKGNLLYDFMRQLFFMYWKDHPVTIDYFLVDYWIDLAYKNIPSVKKAIDSLAWKELPLYRLDNLLNERFDPGTYSCLCETTPVHKLTWRKSVYKRTKRNEYTFYGYLLNISSGWMPCQRAYLEKKP